MSAPLPLPLLPLLLAPLAAAAACVPAYVAGAQAYPAATQAAPNATSFSLTYFTSYKLISVPSASTLVTLRPCGAPVPAPALPAGWTAVHLVAPIARAAVLATPHLPWLELLGQTAAIVAVDGAALVYSPCVRAAVAAGACADVADVGDDYTNSTALSLVAPDAVFCSAGWGCPGTAVDVPVADAAETTAQGLANYLVFFGAFFNVEAQAAVVASSIATRYACTRAAAQALLADLVPARAPAVFWGYLYGGAWYLASCPNWYCQLIADAGGALLLPAGPGTGAYGGYTSAQIAPLLKQATVWIYPDVTFDSVLSSTDTVLIAAMAASPAVSNKTVFDIQKSGVNAWFETREAQPDAFLQDLLVAMGAAIAPEGDAAIVASSHKRIWLRSIMTGEAIGALPSLSTCGSASAASALQSDTCATMQLLSKGLSAKPVASSTSSPQRLSASATAGLAVGVCAAMLLLAGLAFVLLRRAVAQRDAPSKAVGAVRSPRASEVP